MKVLLLALVTLFAAATLGEPPRRRSRPAWGARLQEEPAPPAAEAPYPPSGWRPAKPFYLPGEYGGPEAGAPEEEEGAATTTTEAPGEATTEGETTTTEAVPEGDNDGAEARDNDTDYEAEPEASPANIPAGVYYVLLPDGRLQRVNYEGAGAAPAGPVSGSYVLQEVVPYNAPLYAYQVPGLIQILKK